MNTPRPPSPDATLTPEERALADRIAQTRPPREPSSALDARILAAAHAAAAPGRSNAPSQRHRRWPAVTAVAATLVLAVGIAWQLRPVDDTRVEYSEAPSAAMRVIAPPGGPQASDDTLQADISQAATADEAAAASVATPLTPAPEATPPAEPPRKPLPAAELRPPQPAVEPQAASAEAPVVFDQPSPMDIPAAPEPRPIAYPATVAAPAPPPAPPAPPAAARRQSASAAPQAISEADADTTTATGESERERRERHELKWMSTPPTGVDAATAIGTTASEGGKAVIAPKADADALDRIEVTGTRVEDFADQPLDEQPPASADSPQVRQAWLQRVRQLLADGQRDAARDSLREYRRRYPQATLPDDLRVLLDE